MRQRHLTAVLSAVAGVALASVLAAPAQAATAGHGRAASSPSGRSADDHRGDRRSGHQPGDRPVGDDHGRGPGSAPAGDDHGRDSGPAGDGRGPGSSPAGDDHRPGPGRPPADGNLHADGTIAAVDADSGTLTLARHGRDGDATETITVRSDATVTLDGATVTLADLPIGARVRLHGTETGDDVRTATAVDAVTNWPLHLDGTVTAVGDGTLTVSRPGPFGAVSVTVAVGADASVTLDGAASTLDAVTTGAQVRIEGTGTADGPTVTKVDARSPTTNAAARTAAKATKAAAKNSKHTAKKAKKEKKPAAGHKR